MPELSKSIIMQLEEHKNKPEHALIGQEVYEDRNDNWSQKISKALAARRAGQDARRDSPPILSTSLRSKP